MWSLCLCWLTEFRHWIDDSTLNQTHHILLLPRFYRIHDAEGLFHVHIESTIKSPRTHRVFDSHPPNESIQIRFLFWIGFPTECILDTNVKWELSVRSRRKDRGRTYWEVFALFFFPFQDEKSITKHLALNTRVPVLHRASICLTHSAISNTIMFVKVICLLVFHSSSPWRVHVHVYDLYRDANSSLCVCVCVKITPGVHQFISLIDRSPRMLFRLLTISSQWHRTYNKAAWISLRMREKKYINIYKYICKQRYSHGSSACSCLKHRGGIKNEGSAYGWQDGESEGGVKVSRGKIKKFFVVKEWPPSN